MPSSVMISKLLNLWDSLIAQGAERFRNFPMPTSRLHRSLVVKLATLEILVRGLSAIGRHITPRQESRGHHHLAPRDSQADDLVECSRIAGL